MSQAIADIGAGIVAVGSLVAAPFTGGASLAGLGLAGALLQAGAAEGQQQQTQANVGNFNYGTGEVFSEQERLVLESLGQDQQAQRHHHHREEQTRLRPPWSRKRTKQG